MMSEKELIVLIEISSRSFLSILEVLSESLPLLPQDYAWGRSQGSGGFDFVLK